MAEARVRLRDAQAQLDLAELADAGGSAEADAACCAALGERSRGQDHRQAAELLRRIAPGGETDARHFGRLIGLKDAAQYGFDEVSASMLTAAQRQARALVEFAAEVLGR